MRLDVFNEVEADEYSAQVLGGEKQDYSFSAKVEATSEVPETAYEAVNRSTFMVIEGLTEIGEEFNEHQFGLDVVKRDYVDELEDVQDAYEILDKNGMDFATNISVEKEGETPQEAIDQLENTEIMPILIGTEDNYNSAILYNPESTPRFQPSVQPTNSTTSKEAQIRQEEIEHVLRELNI